ncbi:MAG: cupin domain-containing protein [Granulosicoccus sp.]
MCFGLSADSSTKLGAWECTPDKFTADRTAAGEHCHIISGRATVTNVGGRGS